MVIGLAVTEANASCSGQLGRRSSAKIPTMRPDLFGHLVIAADARLPRQPRRAIQANFPFIVEIRGQTREIWTPGDLAP